MRKSGERWRGKMKGSSRCVDGAETKTYREDVAAHPQNATAWSVGVTAVTPAESECCQSTVVPLEVSDDE